MKSHVVNQMAFLQTSRNFPEDISDLTEEINKAYIDIANAVNNRTISIFPTNRPAINGESWFVDRNRSQKGLRQVYPFTAATLAASGGVIAHGINFDEVFAFTRIYGTFTDGTNWYPLPFVAIVGGVASQIGLAVDPTNIEINEGGGGSQPTVVSGYVVLEWISDV